MNATNGSTPGLIEEPECPNDAIYEGGVEWAIADGNTSVLLPGQDD